MRLSIMPLVLSLFIAFSAFGETINSEFDNTIVSPKTLIFKVVTAKSSTNSTKLPIKANSDVETNATAGKAVKSSTSIVHSEMEGISSIEENSYKITPTLATDSLKNGAVKTYSEASMSAAGKILFKQGFFYGFALMVVLLNLVCFILFEEKVFLYYSLALASLTMVLFNSDGLLALFGLETIENGFITGSVLLTLAVGAGAVFAQKYLNMIEFYPKLKWITTLMYVSACLLVFSAWATKSMEIVIAAHTLLFGILITYFGAGVLLFSRKNYAKFYVIAASIPLLFAVDFYVLKPLGFHFLFTETVHLKFALFAEMIILTYAIMFRMKAIKEEHIMRQTEMRIFLKRQESLSRHNVEKLMEDMYLENLIMHYDLDGLEIKLLQYISEGKENEKIARKLKMTEEDIEDLTKELYQKLEISEHIQEDYRIVESQPDYIYN